MHILLPPSETKLQGGTGRSLVLEQLSFSELTPFRHALVSAVSALADDHDASVAALKLGPTQHAEVAVNRELWSSPTMPTIDRYTGVLYDALDAATLTSQARSFARARLSVHSALFGLTGALDPIPSYRMSHDSRVPGFSLKKHWRQPITASLAEDSSLVIDLRSESYVELGPVPADRPSVFIRVLAEAPDGAKRALNHFNKHTKGEFTRSLLRAGDDIGSRDELVEWADEHGWRIEKHRDGELALIITQPAPLRRKVAS